MKKYIATAVLLMCTVIIIAQVPAATKEAAKLYQEKSYEEARALIDGSAAGEGASNAYTWHVRGHIHKEIYKQVDKFESKSQSRDMAVESFVKSLELDSENEYKEWNRTSLKYLASTYWNDAVNVIENTESEGLPEAEASFEKYLNTLGLFQRDFDSKKVTVDFYKAYATANRKIIEKKRNMGVSPEMYRTEFNRIEKSYDIALDRSREDYGSNYNYAINLYNEAAYRIERIPADADLTVLLLEQEGCIGIFKKARPFAETAYEQKPGRIEILKALRAIYLSLSEYELFEKYDLMIKEKQGEIGTPSDPNLNNLRDSGILKLDK